MKLLTKEIEKRLPPLYATEVLHALGWLDVVRP